MTKNANKLIKHMGTVSFNTIILRHYYAKKNGWLTLNSNVILINWFYVKFPLQR